jgi:hypothetical protein
MVDSRNEQVLHATGRIPLCRQGRVDQFQRLAPQGSRTVEVLEIRFMIVGQHS